MRVLSNSVLANNVVVRLSTNEDSAIGKNVGEMTLQSIIFVHFLGSWEFMLLVAL